MKIAFFSTKPYDRTFFNAANTPYGFEINYFDARLTLNTVSLAHGHDVACLFVNDQVSAEIVDALCQAGVKLLALRSSGYDHIDLKAAEGKLTVVRVPRYSPYSVAEHAVAMMLSLNRKLHLASQRTRANNFSIDGLLGFDMRGKTAGIIGCGEIGKTVIQILKGFEMRILGYDVEKGQIERAGCLSADLQTLFKESDILSLHCPLTLQSRHMINEQTLSQVKEGAMLINTGRGALIEAPALIQALKTKKIGAAGLDVYEGEAPYFYEDLSSTFLQDDNLARLQTFPNVLITAHQGFFTREAVENIAHISLENIQAFFNNRPLLNEVKHG